MRDDRVRMEPALAATAARDRAFTATFALIATAVACTIVILYAPRPVEPRELPALRLDANAVAEALASDRELAKRAPRSSEVDRLLTLYQREGLSERAPGNDQYKLASQREEFAVAARQALLLLNDDGARALLASLTERAMAALGGELPVHESQGLLGLFPEQLRRYGYIDTQGALIAPELAVRALYKARVNLFCGRARDASLRPVERHALHGFLALHASALPGSERALAAKAFYEAGGHASDEALAVWMYRGGIRAQARALFEAAYARSGALRLRNMALFLARSD
jgi:hypothetical protein